MLGLRTAPAAAATVALTLVAGRAPAQDALPQLPAAPTPPALVRVHVDSPGDFELRRDTPTGWRTVCSGACDALLPLDGSYRASGATIFPSSAFTLRAPAGETETLRIHAGSEPLFVLGMVGVVGGGLVLSITWPVGAIFGLCLGMVGLSGGSPSAQGCVLDGTQGMLTAFFVSGAIAIVGTVLVATNARTTVDHLFPSTDQAASSPSVQVLGLTPTPSWRERAPDSQPPPLAVPLLQGRF